MTDAVIFDLDGTVCDNAHRRPLLEAERPDWRRFNATIGDDLVCEPIAKLLRTLHSAGNAVVLCSGRDGGFRKVTELWLTFNGVPWDRLYMRPAGDSRKDEIVKAELLEEIRRDGFAPWIVVDDRSRVVAMWRRAGLTCLQCADGDF